MAASYTWPVGLPQKPISGSFSESKGFNILRAPMDAGPAKMRKRSNRSNMMSLSFLMTDSELDTLETFITSTISGIARFYYDHPITGDTLEVRVVPDSDGGLYSVSHVSKDNYSVTLTFEVMP